MTPCQHLTLFITGDAPRSRRARANLTATLHEVGIGADAVREVDLLDDAQPALEYGIFATPALVIGPADREPTVMYGDLSERDKLRSLIGQIQGE